MVMAVPAVAAALCCCGMVSPSGRSAGLASVRLASVRLPPLCNAVVARAPKLGRIATKMLEMPGNPFGVAVTPDGRWDLAAGGNAVVVVRNSGNAPQPAMGAFEVAFSPGGRFAFVTIAGDQKVAVFNLGRALTAGFGPADYIGAIPAGQSNVGIVASPGYRWLYVTSEASSPGSRHGLLSVVNLAEAETDPARSVVSTVDAGCRPVRVVVSGDGKTVWVSARQSNAVLAFSASRLLTDPRHALITWVRVGVQPIGLVTVNCGSQLVVADSHRFKSRYGPPSLAVVDVHAALTGHPALVGYLRSGLDPRQLAVAPDGRDLLVGNFGSGQLETVTLTHLPGASGSCRDAAVAAAGR